MSVWEWRPGSGFVEKSYSPLSHHKYTVTGVHFDGDATVLATSSLDGNATLCDVEVSSGPYGEKIWVYAGVKTFRFRVKKSVVHAGKTVRNSRRHGAGSVAVCGQWRTNVGNALPRRGDCRAAKESELHGERVGYSFADRRQRE